MKNKNKKASKALPFIFLPVITGETKPEEVVKSINDSIEGFKKELSEAATKEELKGIDQKLDAFAKENEKNEALQATVKELREDIKILKENNNVTITGEGDVFALIEKGLAEFLPRVKEQGQKAGGVEKEWELELEVKAPITMLTTAITNNVNTPVNYVYQQVTEYAADPRARQYILPYLSNGNTNKASLPYMDKIPTEGTMAITAEGALKPLISVSFTLRYSTAKKMAGRVKISEEALDDIPNIMSIIRNELMYQHDIAIQADVFTTVAAFAPAFVAGSLAATTDAPTNYDAIRAAIYAVKIASKGAYIPNAVVVPSADLYAMGASKDTTNQYVFPPFVLPDGTRVEGVAVVEDPYGVLAAGNFIVGDWKKLHRDVYKSFTVRIGQGIMGSATAANIVSDFESNMYTLIGESRYHLWIYENEKTAFIKSTFAAVKTAIESV